MYLRVREIVMLQWVYHSVHMNENNGLLLISLPTENICIINR